MKKHTISRLLVVIFILNIYSYKVQAVPNNSLSDNLKQDKSGIKSKILRDYEKNKVMKNFKSDEILIKAKIGTGSSSIEAQEKKYSLQGKKHLNQQLDIVKFDSNKYSMDEMLLNLNNDSSFEYAEPNYISHLSSSPENEQYFSSLWGLNNTTSLGIDINVENAWKVSTGNPNLVMGVIDSGIDFLHEDLKNNIWHNVNEIPNNVIDDDNDGYVDDTNGWDFVDNDNNIYDGNSHGTHVSGIIAASFNGIGTVGVAPNIKIMPLKAADAGGNLYTSDVVRAIQYGVSKGVKLFNCSFGSNDFSQALYDVMQSSNALFICAAGNGDANGNGLDTDSTVKNYPSSFDLPNIISVASIDKYGNLSTFSNYGAVSVDIAAPGSNIYSTVPGGYAYKSGTSMATPYVAGVAALVLSQDMNLSPIEVKNYILQSTHKLPQLKDKIATGAIVDAYGAMALVNPPVRVPTDVDGNGIIDIKDLALVSSAYNSRTGSSNYKSILDLNNDGIIDIYDLIRVSKVMQ